MVTGQADSNGKVLRKKFKDGTTNKLRYRYERTCAEIDHLEKKRSWKYFQLPQNDEERTKLKDMLLAARYKMEDILNYEIQHQLEINKKNLDILRKHGDEYREEVKKSTDEPKFSIEAEPLPEMKNGVASVETKDQSDPNHNYLKKIGKKGGQKPKFTQPILEAIKIFIIKRTKTQNWSNTQIEKFFFKKIKEKDPMIITIEKIKWEVFCADEHVISRIHESYGAKDNNKEKLIAYNTLLNIYIPKAKKAIIPLTDQ